MSSTAGVVAFDSLLPTLRSVAPELSPAPPAVRIGLTPGKGRGVFAARDIKAGEIIEVSPVVVVPPEQAGLVYGTVLELYVFDWSTDASSFAVALGYGSLFNHSYLPNVRYVKRYEDGLIEFHALRDVREGEELTANYNGVPEDMTPVWFPTVDDGRGG